MKLVAVPYYWDRKKTFVDKAQLRKKFLTSFERRDGRAWTVLGISAYSMTAMEELFGLTPSQMLPGQRVDDKDLIVVVSDVEGNDKTPYCVRVLQDGKLAVSGISD